MRANIVVLLLAFFMVSTSCASSGKIVENKYDMGNVCNIYEARTGLNFDPKYKRRAFSDYIYASFNDLIKEKAGYVVTSYDGYEAMISSYSNTEKYVFIFSINNLDLMSKILSAYLLYDNNINELVDKHGLIIVDHSQFSDETLEITQELGVWSPSILIMEKDSSSTNGWNPVGKRILDECLSNIELIKYMERVIEKESN